MQRWLPRERDAKAIHGLPAKGLIVMRRGNPSPLALLGLAAVAGLQNPTRRMRR
jgi:hypothetical protein